MRLFNQKLLVKEIKTENKWNYEDKEEVKHGIVSFAFKGENVELKRDDEVFYQYGNNVKIEGNEFVLVSESNLIAQK